jgi:PAS domain S-box-containing protein
MPAIPGGSRWSTSPKAGRRKIRDGPEEAIRHPAWRMLCSHQGVIKTANRPDLSLEDHLSSDFRLPFRPKASVAASDHPSSGISSLRAAQAARLAGSVVFLLGLVVLLGWLSGSVVLKSVVPGWLAMAPSTALCFALAGLTLERATLGDGLPFRRQPYFCYFGMAAIGGVGLLRLADQFTGRPLGIDHYFLRQTQGALPAQMAVPTALGFLLAVLALALVRSRYLKLFQFFVLMGGLVGWLGLSSYVFDRVSLLFFAPMAMHTSLTFIILNIGLLCLRPDGGVVGLFLRESTGGSLLRHLLPAILFVPLLVGWLCLTGTHAGWFGVAGGASLFTFTNVAIFGALIWKNAALLDRSDRQRRQAEEDLLGTSSRLREQAGLLEEANVIGWQLTDGIFFWNKGAQDLYGWKPEEALGKPSHELLHTRFPKPLHEIRSQLFSTGHWEGELVHRKRDGTEVVVASSWKLRRSERGGVATVVEVDNEITELKAAEAKLQAQLSRLRLLDQITRAVAERQDLPSIFQVVIRSLEDNLPIDFGCVCQRDPAGNALVVASAGLRGDKLAIKSGTRFEVADNGLERCLRGELIYEPDTRELSVPLLRRLALADLRSLVLSPLMIDGQGFGVLMVARRGAKAFSSGECEFLRQVSEHVALASQQAQLYGALQRAYEDLRQNQQAMAQQERLRAFGEMASGMAHDINNVLSPVMLYTGLLLEQEPALTADSRRQVETIQRAIGDIAETISRMKEFYRQREPQPNLAPVQMNTLIPQVVELTRLRWNDMPQERGIVIDVKTELAADLPAMPGVESEIREALVNLIFNAVDAMPKGGTLTLRTRAIEKSVCLEVADTGTGMSEETKRHCLEPFYTTKGEKGTGLGLAMVYGAMQRHTAELEIDSEPGRGTTFRLIFPGNSASSEKTPTSAAAPGRAVAPLRILVVDDDPLLLKSLREFLEADGHSIATASGGQAGIDAFRAAPADQAFDLVMTDLGMPYVDGRAVANAIKSVSPKTPVLLLTGWGKRMESDSDLPPNIDRVLSKPPKLYEMREALARYA